jgi:hypothetical protein
MTPEEIITDEEIARVIREMIDGNPSAGPLVTAVRLTLPILADLAQRAIEIDDPRLNILMLRLALYEMPAEERQAAIEMQAARIGEVR